jgi:hypothetical protein
MDMGSLAWMMKKHGKDIEAEQMEQEVAEMEERIRSREHLSS